jgi:hypothetical protein
MNGCFQQRFTSLISFNTDRRRVPDFCTAQKKTDRAALTIAFAFNSNASVLSCVALNDDQVTG